MSTILDSDDIMVDSIFKELESSTDGMMLLGQHDGDCTNVAQKALFESLDKVPPCRKCLNAIKKRVEKLAVVGSQVKLLKDMSDDRMVEAVLKELDLVVKDACLLKQHEGDCTNEMQKAQYAAISSIPLCKKHIETMNRRKERVFTAISQVRLFKGMVGF